MEQASTGLRLHLPEPRLRLWLKTLQRLSLCVMPMAASHFGTLVNTPMCLRQICVN